MPQPGISLRRVGFALVLLLTAGAAAVAGEFVEVSVPLREGCYFSPRALCAECNQKLGTHFPLSLVPEREHRLSDAERKALVVASAVGLLRVEVGDRLVVKLPNPQDDATRLRHRALVEKFLGISMEWPAKNGLHLPEGFHPESRTILLVHGLDSSAQEFRRFEQACRAWGVQTLIFDYPNDGPIAWAGDRLSDDLKSLSEKNPGLHLAVVAHSMGGLVCRYCLETPGKQPACVSHLFTLGTPHTGSPLSDMQPLVELFRESLKKNLVTWGTVQDGLGEAADDLRPGSEFLTTLNARPRPPEGVTYHCAAGAKSPVPRPVLRAAQAAATRMTLGKPRDELLALLTLPELDSDTGDGAVAIEAALLAGVEDRRTFELTHMQLVTLPGDRPQDCEVFQWIVGALDWEPVP